VDGLYHILRSPLRRLQIFTSEPEYIKVSGGAHLNSIHTEPATIQRILATDFEHFEKGPLFRSYMKSLLGTGVFNADGEKSLLSRTQSQSDLK